MAIDIFGHDEDENDDGMYLMTEGVKVKGKDGAGSWDAVQKARTILESIKTTRPDAGTLRQAKANLASAYAAYNGTSITEEMVLIEDQAAAEARIKRLRDLRNEHLAEVGRLKASGGTQDEIDSRLRLINKWGEEIDRHDKTKAQSQKGSEPEKQEAEPEKKKTEPEKPFTATVSSGGGENKWKQAQLGGRFAPQQDQKPATPPPASTGGHGSQQQQGQQQKQGGGGQQQGQQKQGDGQQQPQKVRRRGGLGAHLVGKSMERYKKQNVVARLLSKKKVQRKVDDVMDKMDSRVQTSADALAGYEKASATHDREGRKLLGVARESKRKAGSWSSKIIPWKKKSNLKDFEDASSAAGSHFQKRDEAERRRSTQYRGFQKVAGDKEDVRRHFRGAGLNASYEAPEHLLALAEDYAQRHGLELDEGALNDLAWKLGRKFAPASTRARGRQLAVPHFRDSKLPYEVDKHSAIKHGYQIKMHKRANKKSGEKAAEYLEKSGAGGTKVSRLDRVIDRLGLRPKEDEYGFVDQRKFNTAPPRKKQAVMSGE